MKTGSDKGVGLRAQEGWEGREECEGGGGLRAGVCGQGKGPGGQLRAQSLQLCIPTVGLRERSPCGCHVTPCTSSGDLSGNPRLVRTSCLWPPVRLRSSLPPLRAAPAALRCPGRRDSNGHPRATDCPLMLMPSCLGWRALYDPCPWLSVHAFHPHPWAVSSISAPASLLCPTMS